MSEIDSAMISCAPAIASSTVATSFSSFTNAFASSSNDFVVDGRICKLDKLRVLKSGKKNIHFILANNLEFGKNGQKLNSYLPCIAWGKVAKQVESMKVNDKIKIHGKLQSREYKKYYSDDEFDIKVAHEIYVDSIELLND